MINDIKNGAQARMTKTLETLKNDLNKMRTGRAHSGLLEHVRVTYYGNEVPLSQVSNIHAENARTLTVTPWEESMVAVIEKAIRTSDLGLNPATAGKVIRVPLPPLTEERRKDLIKVVRDEAEQARVAIRNVRRDANNDLKNLLKDKSISEDEERRAQAEVQKLTDKFIGDIDHMLTAKEAELMEV
jgi:ribosome recycling factor